MVQVAQLVHVRRPVLRLVLYHQTNEAGLSWERGGEGPEAAKREITNAKQEYRGQEKIVNRSIGVQAEGLKKRSIDHCLEHSADEHDTIHR